MPNKKYEISDDLMQHYARATGDSRVLSDWIRTFREGTFKVNGVAVGDYDINVNGKPIGSFPEAPTEEDAKEILLKLRQFFSEELLKKIPPTSENKEKMLDYLMLNLHQGGLLRIVSLSLGNLFEKSHAGAVLVGEVMEQSIDFQATQDGFEIKESGKINTLSFKDPKKGLMPEQPGGALIDIKQSRVEVDFHNLYQKPENSTEKVSEFEPSITQHECVIDFVNESVNQKLLDRGLIRELPKWEMFHTRNRALTDETLTVVKKENQLEEKAFVAAWQKAIKNNDIKINGKPLSDYDAADVNDHKGIKQFVSDVMLSKFPKDDPLGKTRALDNLMMHLMQEGALSPVAMGVKQLVDHAFKKEGDGAIKMSMSRSLNIISTEFGIDMQERVRVKKLTLSPKGEEAKTMLPDGGKSHVMKCQATICLDVSGETLSAKVQNNTVSYGNKEVSGNKRMDPRSWPQKLFDFLARTVFKAHKINHVELEADEQSDKVGLDVEKNSSVSFKH